MSKVVLVVNFANTTKFIFTRGQSNILNKYKKYRFRFLQKLLSFVQERLLQIIRIAHTFRLNKKIITMSQSSTKAGVKN